MARDLEKKRLYNSEYHKKMKKEKEDKRTLKSAKQAAKQRAYRKREK